MRLKPYLRGLGIGIAATALILHFSGSGKNTEMSDEQIRARAAELGMVEKMTLADAQNGEKPTAPPREMEATTTPEAASADPTDVEVTPTSEATPTPEPTAMPTEVPTATPTPELTATPTPEPTATPKPTVTPTAEPTATSTPKPTATPAPTTAPTATPTPTTSPTPTAVPTVENAKPGYAVNTENVTITVRSGDGSLSVARRMAEAGVVASAKELDDYLCAHGYDRKICTGAHVIPAGASYEEIGKIITTK